jgi:general secretion pathway protein D
LQGRVSLKKRLASVFTAAILAFSLAAPLAASAKGGVVLNFTDVDISTMVKFISDLTGKNFVMDDRVKGKISVFSPSKLTSEEAFNVFTSVLELKGFTVIPSGKIYKIVPVSAARQSGTRLLTGEDRTPVNESYVARLIPLEKITAQEAVSFLQPIISKDGYIAAFGPANMILVVDSALNIRKLMDILEMVDTEQHREAPELIFLKNAGAESVANVLKEWLGGKEKGVQRAPGQTGGAAPGMLILPDARLNALVITGDKKDKEDIRNLVSLLDVAPPTTSSKINVYYLENADATEVGKVLDAMVKGAGAAAPTPQGSPQAAPQQTAFEGGKVTITPDKATNSLVIMASPVDYQNLVQVIQKLDKRRRQVFVQAVVAEVSLDKLKEFGTEIGALGAGTSGDVAGAGVIDPFNFLGGGTAQQQALLSAFKTLGGRNVNLSAQIKALQSNGAVNVLSTPNIMTSDNKEAEIFVGENVPFVSGTNLSSTGLSQQAVERKDTGITLRITPQISEGEYVKLDIYQEISAVKDSKGQAADLVTTKRSAKTSIVVKDKETVVIGGLIQDQETETINKVPLLGDIPVLGWLFKSKKAQRQKTNLMIVLTPRIVRGVQEMGEVTDGQRQKFGEAVKTDEPFSLQGELKPKQ